VTSTTLHCTECPSTAGSRGQCGSHKDSMNNVLHSACHPDHDHAYHFFLYTQTRHFNGQFLGKPELAGNYLNLQSPVWPRLYIHRVLPTVPPTYNNHHSMSKGVLKQKFIQAGCPSCGPTYSVHSKHGRHCFLHTAAGGRYAAASGGRTSWPPS